MRARFAHIFKKLAQSLFLIFLLLCSTIYGQDINYDYSGEISTWGGGYSILDKGNYFAGARILPSFSGRSQFNTSSLELNITLNGYLSYRDNWEQELKLYRSSLTYQSSQAEAIVGLQKITFGPARYLRPLMWFDRISPTDPLNITAGVTGSLFRYYTMNNTNFWIWSLYGNDESKGLEQTGTKESTPEIGGRIQLPLDKGDIALSVHGRKRADTNIEKRIALDGYFDIGIGLWYEARLDIINNLPNRKYLTIGGDYTFSIGNGLNFVTEIMPMEFSGDDYILNDPQETLWAASLSYPLNIFDDIMGLVYYSESQNQFYQYLQYQRTYDRIRINLGVFNYPETDFSLPMGGNLNRSGLGCQVMLIYNY